MGKLPNGEVITDEEFAHRPQDWPTWPTLPLKRRGAQGVGWETGMLIEMPTSWVGEVASGGLPTNMGYCIPTIVFLGDIYDGKTVDARERVAYGSMGMLFAAGWVVD